MPTAHNINSSPRGKPGLAAGCFRDEIWRFMCMNQTKAMARVWNADHRGFDFTGISSFHNYGVAVIVSSVLVQSVPSR